MFILHNKKIHTGFAHAYTNYDDYMRKYDCGLVGSRVNYGGIIP